MEIKTSEAGNLQKLPASFKPDLAMAKNILQRGQRPADIGIMESLDTTISVNTRTAKCISLQLSTHAMSMATEVFE